MDEHDDWMNLTIAEFLVRGGKYAMSFYRDSTNGMRTVPPAAKGIWEDVAFVLD